MGDLDAQQAYLDFTRRAYDALALLSSCDQVVSGNLAGQISLPPGVYCVDAASTTTQAAR